MPDLSTRDQIVEAADDLFYRHGFDHTSFADIAGAVKISRGNFYYHFKSKDEILEAVITRRLAATKAMLEAWEGESDSPRARIESFVRILITNQAKIMLYGCPVGTLCAELSKLDHPSRGDATRLFALFRDFLTRQFVLFGSGRQAEAHALHVLAFSQGVASLANAFRDEAFVQREVEAIGLWLDGLAA
jgi:TetR/AcrR family transcriptional repressor of nem operon